MKEKHKETKRQKNYKVGNKSKTLLVDIRQKGSSKPQTDAHRSQIQKGLNEEKD